MKRMLSLLLAGFAMVFAACLLWTPAVPVAAQEIMPTPTPTASPAPATHPIYASGVTASTHDGNIPGNTVDRDLATRWAGYGEGAWIEYDLGATARLGAVQAAVYRGNARRNRFDLLLSTDRMSWRTVFSGSSSGTTTQLESYTFPPQDARYIRYVGHGNQPIPTGSMSLWNSVTEVALLSTQSPNVPPARELQALPVHDAGAIQVRWLPVSGANLYRLYRSQTRGGPYAITASTGNPDFLQFGLTNNVQYCYVVTTIIGLAESRYSNESCATATVMPTPPRPTPFPPPTTPTNLVARNGGVDCDGQVVLPLRLTWDPSQHVAGYWVFKSAGAGQPATQVASVTSPEWSTSTVTSGFFFVVAQNPHGVSGRSNEVFGTFAVPGCPAPIVLTPPASGVSASTHDGNVPGNTVDNDLATRWSGSGDGATLTFDLGSPRMVARVSVAVYRGNERKNAFDIQASEDLVDWTTVWSGQSSGTTPNPEIYQFVDRRARYVRYLGHRSVSNTDASIPWNSVTEVDIFGY
jgi:hypothetical protein